MIKANTSTTTLFNLNQLSKTEIILKWSEYFRDQLENTRKIKAQMQAVAIEHILSLLQSEQNYEEGKVPDEIAGIVNLIDSLKSKGSQTQFDMLKSSLINQRLLILAEFKEQDKVELIFSLAEQE